MSLILCVLAGTIFAASSYLLLRRNRLEALIGFALLTNAANLAILAASGWSPAERPPILAEKDATVAVGAAAPAKADRSEYADPVPQALVLTAIVIGFALTGFAMAMAARLSELEAKESPGATGSDAEAGDAPAPKEGDA